MRKLGKLTIVFIPEGARATRQFTLPRILIKCLLSATFVFSGVFAYLLLDYIELRRMRINYNAMVAENEGIKGEARLLMSNLEEVKRSLSQVQDYSAKLFELTQYRVKSVSKKTGIGPLSPEEYNVARLQAEDETAPASSIPLGIEMDKLVFQPVFDRLNELGQQANHNSFELQKLLANLSQQKSLLESIPSISPVNGWVTSNFGGRVSPFTGERGMHQGIDIASPVGTPVLAPAEGVVIFNGKKDGYGNFIQIAHGYGLITRYGHTSENLVQIGQRVRRGDRIATVGMTGRTTGPHLHYEVVVNGRHIDPKKFILDLSY